MRTCIACGEPEDGGQFGWFDAPDGLVCQACGHAPVARFVVVRLGRGAYLVNDRYEVNRTREGAIHTSAVVWYWRDRKDPTRRHWYFDTKRAALDALASHVAGADTTSKTPPQT